MHQSGANHERASRGGIRILLADDHGLVRQGLRRMLERQPDLRVVGEAANGRMAVAMASELEPDAILMDVTMPEMNGIDATREVARRHPRMAVLGMSMHRDGVYVQEMLKAGARGYVLKECSEGELVSAVRHVCEGGAWLSSELRTTAMAGAEVPLDEPIGRLSSREREVLLLIAGGRSNQEIASRLHLSVFTVEAHRSRVMEKLNLHSGADVVEFAARHGIHG